MGSDRDSLYSDELTSDRIRELAKSGGRRKGLDNYYWLISLIFVVAVWQIASSNLNSEILLPTPWQTARALWKSVSDIEIIQDLLITLRRVISGFSVAMLIGLPLGYLMGYSRAVLKLLDPLINSIRQVPIMAWVPLTILWFGLGDGPTVFLIAFSAVFPIMLNTIVGVQEISPDYYNAARSMGAGPMSIFTHVIVPGSLPGIMTGMRVGMGIGWMSVI